MSLSYFRCWDKLELKFSEGTTLIKGQSGSGKSTIFQAIVWVLYGNLQKVAPHTNPKAKTEVVLKLKNFKIVRSKNPNRLIVNDKFEDKVAQSMINNEFGNYDIWLSSSYIGQGCRNSFLTSPNAGKMELLNSIAFHEEDPSEFISKLDSKISEIKNNYNNKLETFNKKMESFNQKIESLNCDDKKLSDDEKQKTIQDLKNNKRELEVQTKLKQQLEIDKGILKNLHKELSILNSEIFEIPVIQINEDLLLLESLVDKLKRRDDLFLQFSKNKVIKLNIQFSEEDFKRVLSEEIRFKNNFEICKSLSLDYKQSAVQERIKKIQDCIDLQDDLKKDEERLSLEKSKNLILKSIRELEIVKDVIFSIPEIKFKEITPPNFSKYNTETISQELENLSHKLGEKQCHLSHIIKCKDILSCPHCQGNVRFNSISLIKINDSPVSQKEIDSCRSEIKQFTDQINDLKAKIVNLNSEHNKIRLIYEKELQEENRRIDNLRQKSEKIKLEIQTQKVQRENRILKIQEKKNELIEIDKKIKSYTILNVKGLLLNKKELQEIQIVLQKLKSVEFLDFIKISSSEIRKNLEDQKLYDIYLTIKDKYLKCLEEIEDNYKNIPLNEVLFKIKKIKDYEQQVSIVKMKKEINERNIVNLKLKIEKFTKNLIEEPDLSIFKSKIENLEQILIIDQQLTILYEEKYQLKIEREELIKLNEEHASTHQLKHIATETECDALEQVISNINSSTEDICNSLFDKEIKLNLNSFKTNKTNSAVKPNINFTISYSGGIYENINQLSGGENDRVSLALTLSLNKLLSSPFIMLDESLSSLDMNFKETALKTIKEHTNGIILIILHDYIEGNFDDVIDVERY